MGGDVSGTGMTPGTRALLAGMAMLAALALAAGIWHEWSSAGPGYAYESIEGQAYSLDPGTGVLRGVFLDGKNSGKTPRAGSSRYVAAGTFRLAEDCDLLLGNDRRPVGAEEFAEALAGNPEPDLTVWALPRDEHPAADHGAALEALGLPSVGDSPFGGYNGVWKAEYEVGRAWLK